MNSGWTGSLKLATVRLPRHTRVKILADGQPAYFYEVPTKYRRVSCCPVHSEALGFELSQAISRANELNAALDAWRKGEPSGPQPGSVAWLIRKYQNSSKYRKLAPKSQRAYDQSLRLLEGYELPSGRSFWSFHIKAIKPQHADALYEKLQWSGGRRRLATANAAMRVARLVWKFAIRRGYAHINPFVAMDLESTGGKTRPALRDEVYRFVQKADEMGFASMGTAAMLAFELCQREGDVIGTISWSDYRRGQGIAVRQHKTGERVAVPLFSDGDALFPELEQRLDSTPRRGPLIIMRDRPDRRTGSYLPYKEDHFRHLFRKIADAAGLPKQFTFMGLRHGGLTELGDAEATDQEMMAISGHRTRQTLTVYSRRSGQQAANAARKRRALRGKGGFETEQTSE